ncbi:hypothetical protein ABG067_007901, partial [Albugo candida]
KVVKNNIDSVSLAHDDVDDVDRIGQVKDVDVLYNGIPLTYDFEIFKFKSDAVVCIGSDLMPLLNICFSGLATSWDSYEPAIEDPIDATANDSEENSNFDFGTKEERNQFMSDIQPLLDENSRIPINSCCTLPGAEVELHID